MYTCMHPLTCVYIYLYETVLPWTLHCMLLLVHNHVTPSSSITAQQEIAAKNSHG